MIPPPPRTGSPCGMLPLSDEELKLNRGGPLLLLWLLPSSPLALELPLELSDSTAEPPTGLLPLPPPTMLDEGDNGRRGFRCGVKGEGSGAAAEGPNGGGGVKSSRMVASTF